LIVDEWAHPQEVIRQRNARFTIYNPVHYPKKKVFEVNHYLYNLHFRFFSSSETKKWKIAGKVPPKKKKSKKHDKN